MVAATAVAEAPAVAEDPIATEPGAADPPPPPKKRIAAAPPPNSSYQRIVQPDGKIYYKKIN